MKLAILFDNLGPYHQARIAAAAGQLSVVAIGFGKTSAEYAWESQEDARFPTLLVNPHGPGRALAAAEFQLRLNETLSQAAPDVVAVPGWSGRGAFCSMLWALSHRKPIVLMSESTAWDEARSGWKEWIKCRIVGLASAGLVGGTPHAAYLRQLGMEEAQIFLGYDVVENDYFSTSADQVRSAEPGATRPYFLASNRFIAKKNLFRLLSAYAAYRQAAAARGHAVWDLCLLGDGALKPQLLAHAEALELPMQAGAPWDQLPQSQGGMVYLPGFRQIAELPKFYARAGIFVHASTSEQWGLVVNEAMAAGLPVLVSQKVGCAQDLVHPGRNGAVFDPENEAELAAWLGKFSDPQFQLERYGAASREIIQAWSPARFATGMSAAVASALAAGPRAARWWERALLTLLSKRS